MSEQEGEKAREKESKREGEGDGMGEGEREGYTTIKVNQKNLSFYMYIVTGYTTSFKLFLEQ